MGYNLTISLRNYQLRKFHHDVNKNERERERDGVKMENREME